MRITLGITLLLLLAPATASAARIEVRDTSLVYTAGPGEVNHPNLQHYIPDASYYLQDSAGPDTERVSPCVEHLGGGLGKTSRCPDALVASALIDLGDRDDVGNIDGNTRLSIPVTVRGGEGNDRLSMHSPTHNTLDGGPGNDELTSEEVAGLVNEDKLIGGDGDDDIRARDNARDSVSCGAGNDKVTADPLDEVSEDCETVTGRQPQPQPFDPWKRSDGRSVGVTINGAARFTNAPDVTLTVLAPDAAARLRLSNDGGFGTWTSAPRVATETYRFRLDSSGPERLPKTVYVRFEGGSLDGSRTFTDDIVLDETRPTVVSARRRGRTLRLRARDATSGVVTMQTARDRRRPAKPIRFRTAVRIARTARWIRVRDGAGNASRWRRVALP
jgi:hypothetical protein